MADPETVMLPRSGVVLTVVDPIESPDWFRAYPLGSHGWMSCFRIHLERLAGGMWRVNAFDGSQNSVRGTLEECIEYADARVMQLRFAILSAVPGAFVVADGPETVERIESAAEAFVSSYRGRLDELSNGCAKAILAALREAGK